MTNLSKKVQNQIIDAIKYAVGKAIEKNMINDISKVEIEIEKPNDLSNGDFSSNIAMKSVKIAKTSPKNVANAIVDNIDIDNTYIERVEIAGPGFINFFLSNFWYQDVVRAIENDGDDYGKSDMGKGKKVIVEYVSANPTGPMHMGNARGGALGDCLASCMQWAGYDVTKEFYINDAGNQIVKFGNSLEARYVQLIKGEDAWEFPEDGYHGEDIIEHMESFIEIHEDAYIDVDSEERKKVFVEYALNRNIGKLRSDLEDYRIVYDSWFPESSLYENNEVEKTVQVLSEKGFTYESEGALWFKSTEFGAEKDDVLIRENGLYTYFAADIAYHRNKIEKRKFDLAIDIWGADHHGHIQRMKGAMEALGLGKDSLEIIIIQLVRLFRDGEIARMSKRTGKTVTLSDLLEETSIDAARFFFNMRQAHSHLDFDLDLAVKKSNDNPVYYVQYAFARIKRIVTIFFDEDVRIKETKDIDLTLLDKKEEIELMRKLIELPDEIEYAAKEFEPSRLTRYLIELAGLFHSFYSACKVKTQDTRLMDARLKLIYSVQMVLGNVLDMLKIDAPEKM